MVEILYGILHSTCCAEHTVCMLVQSLDSSLARPHIQPARVNHQPQYNTLRPSFGLPAVVLMPRKAPQLQRSLLQPSALNGVLPYHADRQSFLTLNPLLLGLSRIRTSKKYCTFVFSKESTLAEITTAHNHSTHFPVSPKVPLSPTRHNVLYVVNNLCLGSRHTHPEQRVRLRRTAIIGEEL